MAGPPMRSAIFLTAVAATTAIMLAAVTGAWFWITADMARQLAAWRSAQRQVGLLVTYAPPRRAGWPFAAELVLRDVAITAQAPAEAGSVSWQAPEVTLRIALLQPGVLSIVPSGPENLHGAGFDVPVTAARLEARVPLSGGLATVEIDSLAAVLPSGRIGADWLSLRLDETHVALSAHEIAVPVSSLPFGGTIAGFTAQAAASIPLRPAADLKAAVSAWRAAGGRVVLEGAELHWGPLDATGAGTVTLDAALQPVATASLHLAGYGALIEGLDRAGVITHSNAQVAATLLNLMARAPAAGGPPAVDLPLTLQDGRLMVGAIPIAQVPTLALP